MPETAGDLLFEPTRTGLHPSELLEIASAWAPRVGTSAGSGQPSDRRWYCRLERNEDYEVWLMGWNAEQSTDLHDHGGSSGAVRVLAGELTETRVMDRTVGSSLIRRSSGASFAFGPEAIHNVSNAGNGPSLSIHVYSPPLSQMSYYEKTEGVLVRTETVEVTAPEPDTQEIQL